MDNPNMQTISDNGLAPSDPNEAALYEILPAGLVHRDPERRRRYDGYRVGRDV